MMEKNVEEILKKSLSGEHDADETLKSEVLGKMKITENKNTIKFGKIIRNTAAIAACFVLCIGAAANMSSAAYNVLSGVPAIGTITELITFRTYTDNSGKNTAYVEKPDIDGYENVTKEIDGYIDEIIADYEADRSMSEAVGETDRLNMTTGYAIVGETEQLFSIKIWTNTVMAGAQEYNKFFVVDKATGEKITFNDLFPTDEDKAELKELLLAKMYEIGTKGDVAYNTDSLVIDENTKFYIDGDNRIILSFDKYEVTAGAFGVQEFIVGALKDGKAELRENGAYHVEKISGEVLDAAMNNLIIKDYNGETHEIFKGDAVIINHGDGLLIGDNVTVYYTGVTKGVIYADILEIF